MRLVIHGNSGLALFASGNINQTTKLSNSTTIRHTKPTKANSATKSGEDDGFPRRSPAVNQPSNQL